MRDANGLGEIVESETDWVGPATMRWLPDRPPAL